MKFSRVYKLVHVTVLLSVAYQVLYKSLYSFFVHIGLYFIRFFFLLFTGFHFILSYYSHANRFSR